MVGIIFGYRMVVIDASANKKSHPKGGLYLYKKQGLYNIHLGFYGYSVVFKNRLLNFFRQVY